MITRNPMKRLVWVDMGKGIAMFLVILYHCENSLRGEYTIEHYSMIYHPFFLPLFFFLSGYLFTSDLKSFSLQKKIEQILRGVVLPYFIFTSVILLPKSIFHSTPISNGIKEILLGQASWFIVSLGGAQLLFAFVLSKIRSLGILTTIACGCLVIGYVIKLLYPYKLPYCLNYCPIVYFWLYTGYLYRRIQNPSMRPSLKYICLTLLILVYASLFFIDNIYFHTTLNLFESKILFYNNYILSIIYSLLGIAMIIGLLRILPSINFIVFMGINSLTIYYLNGGVCKIIALLINKMDFFCHPRHTYIGVILTAILCSLITSYMADIIRHKFPLLVGDKVAYERFKRLLKLK